MKTKNKEKKEKLSIKVVQIRRLPWWERLFHDSKEVEVTMQVMPRDELITAYCWMSEGSVRRVVDIALYEHKTYELEGTEWSLPKEGETS